MLPRLKKLLPKWAVNEYHLLLAHLAALLYGHPSRRLVVIGVTGTDGKTTTSWMIAQLLKASGVKVGLSSTVMTMIGDRTTLNESHMTMPGRFTLQRQLADMVKAGCTYAVIEMSSQGLAQNRHIGIDIDCAVITNLTPEHIEAHGGFEAYRRAKGILFGQIVRGGDKHVAAATVKKVTVVNLDDPHAEYFFSFWAEEHHGVSLKAAPEIPLKLKEKTQIWQGSNVHPVGEGMSFTVNGVNATVPYPGEYNVHNAMEAVAVATAYGVPMEKCVGALATMPPLPGRAERIALPNGGVAVIDYAVTPVALESFYKTLKAEGAKNIIGVFGAAGGGRDHWKRPELGRIAAEYCSEIILTTEDPDDENPQEIADAILAGMSDVGRAKTKIVLDRGEAIKQGIGHAVAGTVVAITGMGSETSMIVKGKKVGWSDVGAVKKST